ncbi:hypothetical protein TRFO_04672 [Tritrichomonas foetus]|uniref:Uncharacterized protein n=1 Tax=Tritrichomonas foetus TaxID=1144522 RepID=A0A1J4KCD7_9EUKA|nr:hypothetical protein TRFO_04672 [Tritrichomonas foetus]|eukprot:OHT09087.1 hypothetical protein TRFO_04672 [Tritrichomonas foetus]
MTNYPPKSQFNEPTCLVAVLENGVNLPSGQMKVKKDSYSVRDLSKIRRAQGSENSEVKERSVSQLKKRKSLDGKGNRLSKFGMDVKDGQRGYLNGEDDELDLARELTMEELQQSMEQFDLTKSGSADFSNNGSQYNSKSGTPCNSKSGINGSSGFGHSGNVSNTTGGGKYSRLSNGRLSRSGAIDKCYKFETMDRETYLALSKLEKDELNNWVNAIRNMIIPYSELNNLMYLEEMQNFAVDILRSTKTVISRLQNAIVGPRFSGKSTFLAVFLSLIAERFASNGQWKKSFFFYLSFKDVSNHIDEPFDLYQTFINATFSQLEAQIPPFKPYAQRIAKFFNEIPTTNSTQFPKRIPVEKDFPVANVKLTKIAENIRKVFSDEDNFVPAIDFIFNLPNVIANVFGLPDVHFIFDDFDVCDVDVVPKPPFLATKQSVSLIDRLKESLKTKSFVICCKDEPKFLEALKSMNGKSKGSDMVTKVVFSNISDIEVDPPESQFEFMVEFENCHKKVRINRETCQGCVGFLVCWEKLVTLGIAVENNQQLQSKLASRYKNKVLRTDEDYKFIDFARKYLPYMLGTENHGPIADVKLINPGM